MGIRFPTSAQQLIQLPSAKAVSDFRQKSALCRQRSAFVTSQDSGNIGPLADLGQLIDFQGGAARLLTVFLDLGRVYGMEGDGMEQNDRNDKDWTDTHYNLVVDVSRGRATLVWLICRTLCLMDDSGNEIEHDSAGHGSDSFHSPEKVLFVASDFKDLAFDCVRHSEPGKEIPTLAIQSLPFPTHEGTNLLLAVYLPQINGCSLIRQAIFVTWDD